MRLLLVTTSFPTRDNPASGVFVSRMLRHLPGNVAVEVLTPAASSPPAADPRPRLTVLPVRYAPSAWQTAAQQPGGIPAALRSSPMSLALVPGLLFGLFLCTLLRSLRADVLHANWIPGGLVAGIAGRLTGRPVITSILGSDFTWAQHSRFARAALYLCMHLSSRVVAVSRAMAAQLKQRFPGQAGKVCWIPYAGDLQNCHDHPLAQQPFTVVVVGSLIPRKRVDLAIGAFKPLAAACPSARLVVIGDGPERKTLQARAQRLGLNGRVRFTGQLAPGCVQEVLRQSSVLVHASRSEGLPNAVLEAMAAGVPVVASDIEGVRELIAHGHSGLLFPDGNARDLSDCLLSLWSDPNLGRRLAGNAQSWLRSRGFSSKSAARKYAALYARVSKAGKPGRERRASKGFQGSGMSH